MRARSSPILSSMDRSRTHRSWLSASVALSGCMFFHSEDGASSSPQGAGGSGASDPVTTGGADVTTSGGGGFGGTGAASASGAGGAGAGAPCDDVTLCEADAEEPCVEACVPGAPGPVGVAAEQLVFLAGDRIHRRLGEPVSLANVSAGPDAFLSVKTTGAFCLSGVEALWTCNGDASCTMHSGPQAWRGCAGGNGDSFFALDGRAPDGTSRELWEIPGNGAPTPEVGEAPFLSGVAAELVRTPNGVTWVGKQDEELQFFNFDGATMKSDVVPMGLTDITSLAPVTNGDFVCRGIKDGPAIAIVDVASANAVAIGSLPMSVAEDGYARVARAGASTVVANGLDGSNPQERIHRCTFTIDSTASIACQVMSEVVVPYDMDDRIFGLAASDEHVFYTRALTSGGPPHTLLWRAKL